MTVFRPEHYNMGLLPPYCLYNSLAMKVAMRVDMQNEKKEMLEKLRCPRATPMRLAERARIDHRNGGTDS